MYLCFFILMKKSLKNNCLSLKINRNITINYGGYKK